MVDFALSDWALSVVTDYLHVVPYLNRVDLLYSVPRPTDDRIASQLFHVDPEGVTQVKFFVNVFDTDDDDGPFTFIPADESRRIIRAIRSLRTRQGNRTSAAIPMTKSTPSRKPLNHQGDWTSRLGCSR